MALNVINNLANSEYLSRLKRKVARLLRSVFLDWSRASWLWKSCAGNRMVLLLCCLGMGKQFLKSSESWSPSISVLLLPSFKIFFHLFTSSSGNKAGTFGASPLANLSLNFRMMVVNTILSVSYFNGVFNRFPMGGSAATRLQKVVIKRMELSATKSSSVMESKVP